MGCTVFWPLVSLVYAISEAHRCVRYADMANGQARWACRSSSMASIALGFAGLEPARLVPLAALHGEASRSFRVGLLATPPSQPPILPSPN